MPRGETSQLGRHSGSLLVNSGSYPTKWRDLYFQGLVFLLSKYVHTSFGIIEKVITVQIKNLNEMKRH